jgi:hypothetical protein
LIWLEVTVLAVLAGLEKNLIWILFMGKSDMAGSSAYILKVVRK